MKETPDGIVRARYLIETPLVPEKAAAILAGEQSIGSYRPVPGEETAEFCRALVTQVEQLEPQAAPTLPSAWVDRGVRPEIFRRARITVEYPAGNAGTNLAAWLATLAGNLYELGELTGVRLERIDFPPHLIQAFPGPQFGVSGTRVLAGVSRGPLIGTIVKPCLGFSPQDYAERVVALVEGGVDFIKDDELMADPPHCPFDERVEAVMAVLRSYREKTGKHVLYAFNLTDDVERMKHKHDKVMAEGGTVVMVNLLAVGLSGLETLRRHAALPIHGHRAGWGMLTRCAALGMDFQPFQLLHRLAGVDQMHIGGFGGKFCEDDETIRAAGRACLARLGPETSGQPIMPVISAGQWGGQAATALSALDSEDALYLAGSGIQSHPMGIAAGVEAIRAAWSAAAANVPLEKAARESPALTRSIEYFGDNSL